MALVRMRRGVFAVNNAEKHNLPKPIHFYGRDAYSIAGFHQVHCLVTVRISDSCRVVLIHDRNAVHYHGGV
jgi:hypothetical protein